MKNVTTIKTYLTVKEAWMYSGCGVNDTHMTKDGQYIVVRNKDTAKIDALKAIGFVVMTGAEIIEKGNAVSLGDIRKREAGYTIKLNNQDYVLGTPALALGLTTRGKYVVCKTIIEKDACGIFYSVCDDCKLVINNLDDYFRDNDDNMANLKAICKEKNAPISTMKKLQKEANAAPQYALYLEGAGYVAEQQNLTGVIFTEQKELARKFAVGFDNPAQKLGIWNVEVKKKFGNDFSLEAVEI